MYLLFVFCICTLPVYLCLICILSSTRHVPDVGNVGGGVGGDLRGHELLLPSLLLPSRLRHAQLCHRGHDLVHHEDGLSLIPGLCVFLCQHFSGILALMFVFVFAYFICICVFIDIFMYFFCVLGRCRHVIK